MDWDSWQETWEAWSNPDSEDLGLEAWVKETVGKIEYDLETRVWE